MDALCISSEVKLKGLNWFIDAVTYCSYATISEYFVFQTANTMILKIDSLSTSSLVFYILSYRCNMQLVIYHTINRAILAYKRYVCMYYLFRAKSVLFPSLASLAFSVL